MKLKMIIIGIIFLFVSQIEMKAVPDVVIWNFSFHGLSGEIDAIFIMTDLDGDGVLDTYYILTEGGVLITEGGLCSLNGGLQTEPFASGDASGYEFKDHTVSACPGSEVEQSWNLYNPSNQIIGNMCNSCQDPSLMTYTTFQSIPKVKIDRSILNNNEAIEIYPNPTDSMLNVKITNPQSEIKYQLFDQVGNIYLSETIEKNQLSFNNEINLDVSNIMNGVYFIKIIQKNKVIHYTKIIIKK